MTTQKTNVQAEIHLQQATVLEAEGNFEAALHECDAALALLPDWADAHYLRGTLLAELERLPEAIAAFERALALDASLHDAREEWVAVQLRLAAGEHLDRALCLHEHGELEQAYLACRFAIALQPEWAAAHNVHGMLLEHLGEYAAALEAYRCALDLEEDYEDARRNAERVRAQLEQEELVAVARYLNVTQAHVARSLLVAEGIEAIVADEGMGGLYGFLSVIGARVMVRASDAKRAEQILEEAFECKREDLEDENFEAEDTEDEALDDDEEEEEQEVA